MMNPLKYYLILFKKFLYPRKVSDYNTILVDENDTMLAVGW